MILKSSPIRQNSSHLINETLRKLTQKWDYQVCWNLRPHLLSFSQGLNGNSFNGRVLLTDAVLCVAEAVYAWLAALQCWVSQVIATVGPWVLTWCIPISDPANLGRGPRTSRSAVLWDSWTFLIKSFFLQLANSQHLRLFLHILDWLSRFSWIYPY